MNPHPHPHFGIVPQFVTDQATGQLFMITQNSSYSYGIGAPQPVPQQMVHPPQIFQQQPVPLPLPAAIPPSIATATNSTVAVTQSPSKEAQHSNSTKPKGIAERHSIAHYIGGQLMIETSKILSEKKSKKKKQQLLLKQRQPEQPESKEQQQQIQQPPPPSPTKQTQESLQQQHMQDYSLTQPNNDKHQNDIHRIRAEMPKWSVDEVVEFIKQHEDIKQYSSKFFDDEVDGKALLIMIDRNLNFQVLTSMFKHGPAMKIEAALSKYKLND